ncbi:DUF6148 family protein [Reyranella sp.]|jgi:hypothetical protein|uniref:DUF6148 family protein n=1 Tax=Reyranella sp. TaxID=1929291 RepID=UPI00261B6C85|nr:DUF6148 family protein [Reyranella sp.]HQS18617.1 DUF6148 family protein [Reyranella sp.]HQT14835.1 DUF6148 family protein [Reyranella sp.]
MPGVTLELAEANLALWLAASAAVSRGQEYEIDTGSGGRRRLRRVDAAEIRQQIDYWQGWMSKLTRTARGRSGTRYLVQ